jgi:biotin transporter BioY
MHGPGYALLIIALLAFPVFAAIRRRVWPFAGYTIGFVIFLTTLGSNDTGWDDLADFALLLVIVLPIYAMTSLLWLCFVIYERWKLNHKKPK